MTHCGPILQGAESDALVVGLGSPGGTTAVAAPDAPLDVLVVEEVACPEAMSMSGAGMASDSDAALHFGPAAFAGGLGSDIGHLHSLDGDIGASSTSARRSVRHVATLPRWDGMVTTSSAVPLDGGLLRPNQQHKEA